MKKIAVFICVFLTFAMLLASCEDAAANVSEELSNIISEASASQDVSQEESLMPIVPDEKAAAYWKDEYATTGIAGAEDVAKFTYWSDNADAPVDVKYLFEGRKTTCAVNLADGYAITVPGTDIVGDFSLSALRSKYSNSELCLTVSRESGNPYGNNEHGWNVYDTEWLSRYISNDDYLSANNLRRTAATRTYTDKVDGYNATCYYIKINDNANIDMPYYVICVLRKPSDYVNFYLLVMKSAEKMNDQFDEMLTTFRPVKQEGKAVNAVGAYELKIPDTWSDRTKTYFESVMADTTVDWGFYYRNLESRRSTSYYTAGKEVDEWMDFVTSDDGLSYDGQYIYATYMPIGWYNDRHYFPKEMAIEKCGGDGTNGKPVLQLSYQFTTNNNGNLYDYTPMFDILRGKYDDHFRELAKSIKEYGAPVWFRLNNEMNSDWVSYCGMVTLLDPDIFIMTWQRLYDIFVEEGVDNCIFVYNPIGVTAPYSSWGEALNYFPGADYCQALGMTYYEMNNGTGADANAFETHHKYLYEKNMPYFDNYPWVIGEFACGAGGEVQYNYGTGKYDNLQLYRNAETQAKYIEYMFNTLASLKDGVTDSNRYISKLKYAIWFSANDYEDVNGQRKITNALNIVGNDTAIDAIKKGLDKLTQE